MALTLTMKIKTYALLILSAGIFLGFAEAKPIDPVPVAMVQYKGEDIPVFEPRQVIPTSTENPHYPDDQRDKRVVGQAVIVVIVGVDGKVIEADIKESKPAPSFGVAAQAAVKKWRWPRVKHNGQPTKFIVQQVVMFEFQ